MWRIARKGGTINSKRFHIIIAEDNRADVTLVREALKLHRVDCEMGVINDGAEAIRYFRALDLDCRLRVPDLVLLDMHLPKHGGEDILKALRSTQRIARTPVVLMTGSSSPAIEEVAQKHAVLYCFFKSCDWEEFAQVGAVVHSLLERDRPNRSEE